MQCRHSRHSRHVRTIEASKTVQTDFPCLYTTCEKPFYYIYCFKKTAKRKQKENIFSVMCRKNGRANRVALPNHSFINLSPFQRYRSRPAPEENCRDGPVCFWFAESVRQNFARKQSLQCDLLRGTLRFAGGLIDPHDGDGFCAAFYYGGLFPGAGDED